MKRRAFGRGPHLRVCGWLTLLTLGCGAQSSIESRKTGDDELQSTSSGSLRVSIAGRGVSVDGIKVTIEPGDVTRVTDEDGSVRFASLAPGYYRVVAVHASGAASSDAVLIRAGETSELDLRLPSSGQTQSTGVGQTGSQTGLPSASADAGVTAGAFEPPGFDTPSRPAASLLDPSELPGPFIDVASQVERMLVDPARPTLYALDRTNNLLHFVDLVNNEVTSSIYIGSRPVDLDISPDGKELFVANFGSTELAVVDLDSQTMARTVFVDTSQGTWEGNPFRLAVTAFNTLVYTSQDQWNDVKMVNATNGGHLFTQGSYYSPDLAANSDGTILFVAESGKGIHRLAVSESSLDVVDSNDSVNGSSRVVMSANDEFAFFGRSKVRATNLKDVVGEFSEPILAASYDGSLAISQSAVFDGVTFAQLEWLPIETPTLALGSDDAVVYLYDTSTSKIYAHTVGSSL